MKKLGVEVIGVSGDSVKNQKIFKDLNKLDYVIAREELTDEILGITPREGNTTIAMLIDDCLSEKIDKIEIDSYIRILWKLHGDFISGRY